MKTLRFDRGTIKSKHITPEGFLRVDAIITRTGVFKYRNKDGSVRNELRHPDDILKTDSLKSIELIPITLDHPKECIVTSDNFRVLARGYVGEKITHDNRLIKANIVVTDKEAIEAIENGVRELSLGYQTVLVEDSGEYEGESYDHRQTEVKYNHLAIVPKGRAGVAKILLDSQDAEMLENENSNQSHKENNMKLVQITLDGITYDVPPEVQRALEKQTKQVTDSGAELVATKESASGLQAKLDAANEEIEKLKKIDHSEAINAAVKSRMEILTAAVKHLNADEAKDIETKSDAEIKIAIIKKYSPEVNLDGKDSAYIQARFDIAIEQKVDTEDPIAKQKKQANDSNKNQPIVNADSAREAYAKSLTEAWKQTI